MGSLPGILFLVLGLLMSVGIHELGHMIPAKAFGVKVSQYFIGFGPTLWSVSRGGTEYGIKAIPLGGFVRIAGMLAPAKPGTPTHKAGRPTLAEEARKESASELAPGEEHQAFWRLPAAKKLVVMFGGPLTNLVLATLLLGVVTAGIGVSTPTTTVGALSPCVGATSAEECAGKEPSPAAASELRPGDVIRAWGPTQVSTWPELSAVIAAGGTSPVTVTIERDGQAREVVITPVPIERQAMEGGKPVLGEDGRPMMMTVPYAGISPRFDRQRLPVITVLGASADMAIATAKIVATLPIQLWNTASSLVTGERDATGVVGIVGVADIAGNITSATADSYTWLDRLADLIMLVAGLNMSLFIFNLIPLLPLDGGHILAGLIEGARRLWAKARGSADPGPFDTARLLPLSQAVFVALIAMTLLLVVADIVNPVI